MFSRNYSQAKSAYVDELAPSILDAAAEAFNRRFDSLIDTYIQLQVTEESLKKRLDEKREELGGAKRGYLRANIDLIRVAQLPEHRATNTPLSRTSKRLIPVTGEEKKTAANTAVDVAVAVATVNIVAPPPKEEAEKGKSEAKEEDKHIPLEFLAPLIAEKTKSAETAADLSSPTMTPANQSKAPPLPPEEDKKAPTSESAPIPVPELRPTPEALEADCVKRLLEHIANTKARLMSPQGGIVTGDSEIRLENISGADLECVLSFLALSDHATETPNQFADSELEFLPNDMCRLCDMLFVADYMMLEPLSELVCGRLVTRKEFDEFPAVRKALAAEAGELLFSNKVERSDTWNKNDLGMGKDTAENAADDDVRPRAGGLHRIAGRCDQQDFPQRIRGLLGATEEVRLGAVPLHVETRRTLRRTPAISSGLMRTYRICPSPSLISTQKRRRWTASRCSRRRWPHSCRWFRVCSNLRGFGWDRWSPGPSAKNTRRRQKSRRSHGFLLDSICTNPS